MNKVKKCLKNVIDGPVTVTIPQEVRELVLVGANVLAVTMTDSIKESHSVQERFDLLYSATLQLISSLTEAGVVTVDQRLTFRKNLTSAAYKEAGN